MTAPATISWLKYGWETSFAAVSTSIDKAFGHGVRVSSLNPKNNMEKIYSCGHRNAQKIVPLKFEGSTSIEFVLSSPWFLKAVMGTTSVTGTGPYTHTFGEYDSIPSFTIENDIATNTATVRKLLGCVASNTVISSAVGEKVTVRMDIDYANETKSSTTSSVVDESFDVFTFAHGSVEMPNGTTIADVQNFEISFGNNPDLIWGHGSRFAQSAPVLNRAYDLKASMAFEDNTMLEQFYGASSGPSADVSEAATMELTFDNGGAGTNQRQVNLLFAGVQLNDHNLPQDPLSRMVEDVTIPLESATVTAINNTATCP